MKKNILRKIENFLGASNGANLMYELLQSCAQSDFEESCITIGFTHDEACYIRFANGRESYTLDELFEAIKRNLSVDCLEKENMEKIRFMFHYLDIWKGDDWRDDLDAANDIFWDFEYCLFDAVIYVVECNNAKAHEKLNKAYNLQSEIRKIVTMDY